MFYKSGVYKHVTGEVLGGHALAIVGYNDADHAWIVRNSWSTAWGEKGYFRIDYDDESGLGQIGYKLDVAAAPTKQKILEPAFLDAFAKTMPLTVSSLAGTHGDVQYTLTNLASSQAMTGTADPTRATTMVDLSKLPDGVYQVAVTSNATGEKPWYSLVIVANKTHSATVKVDPDFTNNAPIKDRVYFKIGTTSDLAMSKMEVHFKKKDGTYEDVQTLENPGDLTSIGWHTETIANGDYEVFAVGKLGTLAKYQSNSVSVTVKN